MTFWQQTFNCYRVVTEETGGLEPCNEDVYNREVPCLCTGLEFDPASIPTARKQQLGFVLIIFYLY